MNTPELFAAGLLTGADGARVWRDLAARFRQKALAEWAAFFAGEDCCVEPLFAT